MVMKMVLVGDSGVGKSCLLSREAMKDFVWENRLCLTIGIDFRIKHYQVDHIDVKALLWDTGVNCRRASIMKSYYRGSAEITQVPMPFFSASV